MDAGLKLKNVREKLGLRYREVEQASNRIAQRHKNSDFAVGLSRLADIENRGVVPNIHRLYSLCAIYRLDFEEVVGWYDVPLPEIWRDAMTVEPSRTHPVDLGDRRQSSVSLPLQLDPGVDFSRTTFLSRVIREWGRVPLSLLETLDLEQYRYGIIGRQDLRMHPMLQPGALVQIDDSQREIEKRAWSNDFERPIYFLEMREAYACCWCSLSGDHLILQPHPGSPVEPEIRRYPNEVEIIGRVVGVAMQLAQPVEKAARGSTRRIRSAATRG